MGVKLELQTFAEKRLTKVGKKRVKKWEKCAKTAKISRKIANMWLKS